MRAKRKSKKLWSFIKGSVKTRVMKLTKGNGEVYFYKNILLSAHKSEVKELCSPNIIQEKRLLINKNY